MGLKFSHRFLDKKGAISVKESLNWIKENCSDFRSFAKDLDMDLLNEIYHDDYEFTPAGDHVQEIDPEHLDDSNDTTENKLLFNEKTVRVCGIVGSTFFNVVVFFSE